MKHFKNASSKCLCSGSKGNSLASFDQVFYFDCTGVALKSVPPHLKQTSTLPWPRDNSGVIWFHCLFVFLGQLQFVSLCLQVPGAQIFYIACKVPSVEMLQLWWDLIPNSIVSKNVFCNFTELEILSNVKFHELFYWWKLLKLLLKLGNCKSQIDAFRASDYVLFLFQT